jgi:hypothetical protein
VPLSLAATPGISIDFSSSGYLDVSVPPVCSPFEVITLTGKRVAPFGHLGINACVPLPRAYRSLPRPSSPPCAQASPTCLRSLDYKHSNRVKQSTRDLSVLSTSDNQKKLMTVLNADSKSTIYHHFRCQIASTSIDRSPAPAAASMQEIELGNWMCSASDLRRLSDARGHLTRHPLRR